MCFIGLDRKPKDIPVRADLGASVFKYPSRDIWNNLSEQVFPVFELFGEIAEDPMNSITM